MYSTFRTHAFLWLHVYLEQIVKTEHQPERWFLSTIFPFRPSPLIFTMVRGVGSFFSGKKRRSDPETWEVVFRSLAKDVHERVVGRTRRELSFYVASIHVCSTILTYIRVRKVYETWVKFYDDFNMLQIRACGVRSKQCYKASVWADERFSLPFTRYVLKPPSNVQGLRSVTENVYVAYQFDWCKICTYER